MYSIALHMLVQLCLNTYNCRIASLFWSLERNQNKYLDHCLLYLVLPDWKLHLLVPLERMIAKPHAFQTLLVQELESIHESTRLLTFLSHLQCFLSFISVCQLYFPIYCLICWIANLFMFKY